MSVRLSCPSCNTGFSLDALPTDRRATCPRCGDVFPVRVTSEEEDRGQKTENRTEQKTESKQPHAVPARKRGLSLVWAVVLVITLGLAGLGVGLLVYYNREPKPQPEPPPPPSANATPPAQLVGLGYLPAECNVVIAIQPGPLLDHASRTGQQPRDVLKSAGLPDQMSGVIDSFGVPLAQIDHIAVGLFLPSGNEDFRAAIALVLKQAPADEDEFLKKLKATPITNKQKLWSVKLNELPFVLTRVSPTVWLFAWTEKEFANVEKGGFGPGGTQFRGSDTEGVRKMIASVPPEAAVWLAADDERDWSQKPLLKTLAPAEMKKWLAATSSGRGVVFATSFGEKPRMRLFVRTAEAATAERVRAYFGARAAETESATAGGGGTFALYDAPYDAKALQRFLSDAAR